LKNKYKQIIALMAVITLSISAFIGCAYAYIYLNSTSSHQSADATQSHIPYSNIPSTVKLRVIFPDNSNMLLTLDFADVSITADFTDDYTASDYTIKTNEEALSGFIDRLGGIEIFYDNTVFRYTGLQAVRLSADGYVEKSKTVNAVFAKIASDGITRPQLTYLLEHCHTDLSVVDCFSWPEWLKNMCCYVTIIK